MKTIGFLLPELNHENRRVILPKNIKMMNNPNLVFIEKNYGNVVGFSDKDFIKLGANVVDRDEVLKCDILIDHKLSESTFASELSRPKILFGWAHAAQNPSFTNPVIEGKHTVYAWENMFYKNHHILYKNNEIAGEAAVFHALTYLGSKENLKIAIIGNGNSARGAMKTLHQLGLDYRVFARKDESEFLEEKFNYDVIVNCVLWDISRKDRLIYKDDLLKFKPGSMIIDVSCNSGLEVETTIPTTLDNPVYTVNNVIHYTATNTPSLFFKDISTILSDTLTPYYELLMVDGNNQVLDGCKIISNGVIIDEEVKHFFEQEKVSP